MKIVRYILDDRGIVLIVDGRPPDDVIAQLRAMFNRWAQMVPGADFPIMVLPGDADTKVDDLRTKTP